MKKKLALLSLALALAPRRSARDKQAPPAARRARRASPCRSRRRSRSRTASRVTLVPYGTVPKVTVRLAVLTGNVNEARQPGLAGRPRRRHAHGGHGHPHRLADRRGRGEDGRLARRRRSARTARTSAATSSRSSARTWSRSSPTSRAHPKFPEAELRARQGRPAAPALDRPQPAAAARAGEVPRGALRRSSVRPALPDRRDAPGLHPRAGSRLLRQELRRGAARTCTSPAASTTAAMEAAIRKAFGDWKQGAPRPASRRPVPKSARAVYILDRPGAVQSTILLGHARHRPVQARLGRAVPDERAARRLVLLADHLEHPRAEGLHLLAERPALQPLPRRVLGRGRRRHDERDRARRSRRSSARSTGCRPSRRRTRSSRDSRTTAPASSSSRTPRARGIIGQLEFVDLHGLPADYLNGYVKRLYASRPQQVQQMAKKYLQDDKATIVVVGRQEGHRGAGQAVRTA